MNIPFRVIPSGLAEMPAMGDRPNTYSARMAFEKSLKVAQSFPDYLVIGADTIVAFEDKILGKPSTPQEAILMLSLLSDQWHDVWTGLSVICLIRKIQIIQVVHSSVHFRALTTDEIEAYVHTGESLDKAGAYAIQGRAKAFVREIKGSYHNIIGLPTFDLARILSQLGIAMDTTSVETIG